MVTVVMVVHSATDFSFSLCFAVFTLLLASTIIVQEQNEHKWK